MTPLAMHRGAMILAYEGDRANADGDHERAVSLWRQASEVETKAARALALDAEPSRSVFFRSAACLAIRAGDLSEAERLAAAGLAEHPPSEIAAELRDVLRRAWASPWAMR